MPYHSFVHHTNHMGYYVSIVQSTFTIPSENVNEAYKAMCQLNHTVANNDKRGGSWPGKDTAPAYGPDKSCWFSWMEWDYDTQCQNAEEILQQLGFSTYFNENGDLLITGYDSKTGQEDLFLKEICPLAHGYIVWQGEDGAIWGENYDGSDVIVRHRSTTDYSDVISSVDEDEVELVNVSVIERPSLPSGT